MLSLPAITLAQTATPAEKAIAEAKRSIQSSPARHEAYSALAMALARRARETSDVAFYTQAEEAVQKSLSIQPDNYAALRARTWILLGKHEFAAALKLAKTLNKRVPDDLMVYGFLTDANAELGNYEEAEKACNWMLKLRPGNIPALTRAAYLRELFGDLDGAIELMGMAYQSTAAAEVEDRAWILTQMAHIRLTAGNIGDAEQMLVQANVLFPDYHYALAQLAKVRISQKRYAEAADLLKRRFQAAQHPENLYDLAEALDLAGRTDEAAAAYARFETASLAESDTADNSNRELIFYYADRAGKQAKALELAEREYARRRDVHTLDAYSWALHMNGRDVEARVYLDMALAVGTRDGRLLGHAREIPANSSARVEPVQLP